jgi:uncharacterized protein (UPF0332 family)
LLSKLGVKCEIHDCTIAIFELLFKNSVSEEVIKDLRNSKEDRVEAQYYTKAIDVDLKQMTIKRKKFVLEIEKLIDGLNSEKTAELQKTLTTLIKTS